MIRLAKFKDLLAIEKCAIAAYSKYVDRIGKEPAPMVANFKYILEKQKLYILEKNGQFIGFIVFYPVGKAMHIENVAVHPSYLGQGFGSRLMYFAENNAIQNGLTNIELYTNELMIENLSYYQSKGYKETYRKEEEGFNRVYFSKLL